MGSNNHIPLLSPKPLNQFTPQDYHDYIISLYALPKPKTGVKKPTIKGKTLKTPTKTRTGLYVIRFETRELEFNFNKDKTIDTSFTHIVEALRVPDALLTKFINKKKFILTKQQTVDTSINE